jgi:uncharacterized protein (DUF1499 family)
MVWNLTPRAAPVAALLLLAACSGPASLSGPDARRLAPCPSAPHCVGSGETGERHAIAGFALREPVRESWQQLVQAVRTTERTTILFADARYLHAEVASRSGLFIDDLELLREGSRVHVRSSSRVGYYDFGANRERVEALRARLAELGVLQ